MCVLVAVSTPGRKKKSAMGAIQLCRKERRRMTERIFYEENAESIKNKAIDLIEAGLRHTDYSGREVKINIGAEKTPVAYNTNADRIRAMSDEELADFIANCGCPDHARDCIGSCTDCVLEWLKQPAEE
jgi:hypothetical protein